MSENDSALEARGDGLASDLDEIDRPIETNGGVVAHRDVECESRLLATPETPHRGFQQHSPQPMPPPGLRPTQLRDEGHGHPMRDLKRAYNPDAPPGAPRR